MTVLIVSDIFGRTKALEMIRRDLLSESGTSIDIIDPYGGINPGFETEALAYAGFMDQVGPDRYRSIVADQVRKLAGSAMGDSNDGCLRKNTRAGPQTVSPGAETQSLPESNSQADSKNILIGFSVGASAVWAISGEPFFKTVNKAVCFYGSRIRNLARVSPLSDVELVFPCQEPHFDVDVLIRRLEPKKRVSIQKTGSGHGFMNRLSNNFNLSDYTRFMAYLKAVLKS